MGDGRGVFRGQGKVVDGLMVVQLLICCLLLHLDVNPEGYTDVPERPNVIIRVHSSSKLIKYCLLLVEVPVDMLPLTLPELELELKMLVLPTLLLCRDS